MLAPKKIKHRKWQRRAGQSGRIASRLTTINFGSAGLKAITAGLVTSREIEAVRRVLVRYIRKGGRIWTRVFPGKPLTTKGSEVGMGGGKGAVDGYVCPVLPGTVLFEMDGVAPKDMQAAFKLAGYKLRVKTKYIAK